MGPLNISTRNDLRVEEILTDHIVRILDRSVKHVKTPEGRIENFEITRLVRSLDRCLRRIQVTDRLKLQKLTEAVLDSLDRNFNGEIVPTIEDIKDTVVMVLIVQGYGPAARWYILNHQRYAYPPKNGAAAGRGIAIGRHFTHIGVHPYDEITWEKRNAVITNDKGDVVFEQKDVEVPSTWSQSATNIVVSKYFRGRIGTPQRETSVKQLVSRVATTMAHWGRKGGYFRTEEDADAFEAELTHILVNQYAAFNSPVWFNVGVSEFPQCSACFINSVDDDMRSILNLAVTEGMLFKYGSGAGSNLSPLRSSKEQLSESSGRSSGPVSFMRGFDAFAGVIKSGGKTRRAAKMVILNVDHPDIVEFVECKAREEKKAWTLIDHGYDGSINGEAYASIFFQNANNSVRVSDSYMQAYLDNGEWELKGVTHGKTVDTINSRDLMQKIAQAAWDCGDPGMQYDTTINRWNPCINSDRIHASNPCVTGDTLVSTSSGYRRIIDLVGSMPEVVGEDGIYSQATKVWKTGHKPVFELATSSGYSIKVTADHKIKTSNRGDVPASELAKGDMIEMGGVGFGVNTLDVSFAEALGLAIGDGCIVRNQIHGQEQVVVTAGNHEKMMLEGVATGLNAYKTQTALDGRGSRASQVYMTSTGVRFATSQKFVVDEMKKYAVLDKGSALKQLTDEVFNLDEASQAAILRGLFTADGTVADYGEKSQYISLDSCSEQLLKTVQLLLLGFGIKSKVYRERRGDTVSSLLPNGKGGMAEYAVQQMYSLRVSRSSRERFEEAIGFIRGSEKNDALRAVNARVSTYRDRFEDEFASLTYLGEEDVYDLTEPITHHFVGNGLLMHNCSEYMFLNDTACNLASINLLKCRTSDGAFNVETYEHVIEMVITAQEITVDNSSYPTPRIEQNSYDFRPLGLGYANLGALLMAQGVAYDSDQGRNVAAALTSIMSGRAYAQSAKIAREIGAFAKYEENREPFMRVMGMHRDAAHALVSAGVQNDLLEAGKNAWEETYELGGQYGYRNAQISVIAPTGTIAFLMDCDTTGIEPDIALVKYKWLVGGGLMKLVNGTVPEALTKLGYTTSQREAILKYIDENDTIEGAPELKSEHLSVFDCAFKPAKGSRSIHYRGHILMMAAVQPFVSGAISKTVNMPTQTTVEEIMETYVEGWKLGLKAIAIYRDGCKRSQPLTTSRESDTQKKVVEEKAPASPIVAVADWSGQRRRRLPDERRSITHKFSVGQHEGYITIGLYDDGAPGEIFIQMSKEGSVISGLMDSFATAVSIGLQYGVPLKVLVNKFAHMRFEPSGYTKNPQIRFAKSVIDYIFRYLATKFLSPEDQITLGIHEVNDVNPQGNVVAAPVERQLMKEPQLPFTKEVKQGVEALTGTFDNTSDAPVCDSCGAIMVRYAACYRCVNCGSTTGCS